MVESRKDSINYQLVMQKFIEQKAGHAGKAADMLAITESEVIAILDGGDVGVKARQSLMRIAAGLRWDTPIRSANNRELTDERLERLSGQDEQNTADDSATQDDRSMPLIVTKGRAPISPHRVAGRFARQRPEDTQEESLRTKVDVEDVFDEIAALTSGDVNAIVTPVEEKVAPPVEEKVEEVFPPFDNEVEDIEQVYERQVDSIAEQVRQEIISELSEELPEESEEISEEVNETFEDSTDHRAVDDLDESELGFERSYVKETMTADLDTAISVVEQRAPGSQQENAPVVEATPTIESAPVIESAPSQDEVRPAVGQDDVDTVDQALIEHLAAMESKGIDGGGESSDSSGVSSKTADGLAIAAERIEYPGEVPQDEILEHYDRLLAEANDPEEIRAHIRRGVYRRLSWLLYEYRKEERELAEKGSESSQRERADRMLDRREDQDPTIISEFPVEGEEDFYNPEALEAIVRWRQLKYNADQFHSMPEDEQASSEYYLCCDEILAIEVYLIQEHGLTIPDESPTQRKVAAWDGLEQKEQIVWRLEDRKRIQEEYENVARDERREKSLEMFKSVGKLPGKLVKIGRK